MVKPWWRDALERILWTAAEAGLSAAIVIVAELDLYWAPILATVLAAVKAWVAKRVGGSGDAAIG